MEEFATEILLNIYKDAVYSLKTIEKKPIC